MALVPLLSAGGSIAQGPPAHDDLMRSDASAILAQDSGKYRTNISTTIASLNSKDVREAPGVITVITAEMIEASGARDLQEALTLVPGFHLGRDADDVVDVSIRGNWAEEAKCLYMLNGQYLNESSYGTYSLGHRIPMENVARIEVISGPGSVIYGGYAALGVVNIVTKDTREFEGAEAVVQGGMANGRYSRLSTQLYGAYVLGPRTEVAYSVRASTGQRSNALTELPDGTPISYADSSGMDNYQFMVGIRTPRAHAQLLYNDRQCQLSQDIYALVQRDLLIDLERDFHLGRNLELTLRSQYRNQLPWNYVNDTAIISALTNTVDQRFGQFVLLQWRPLRWLDLRSGISAYSEVSRFVGRDVTFNTSDSRELRAQDAACFGEATASGRWGNLTAGARMEKNSFTDLVFAPRTAWTKAGRNIHGKILYSTAFKLPTLQNIEIGPTDQPLRNEWSYTTELEVGWRSGRSTDLSVSAFSVDIRDPIVYVYEDGSLLDNYINRERAGTSGVELKLQRSSAPMLLYIAYAYYQVNRERSALPEVELPAPFDRSYQGVPSHSFTAVAEWKPDGPFAFNTRIGLQSRMWTYQYMSTDADSLELMEHTGGLVLDLGLRYAPRSIKGFSARFGVRDLLGVNGAIPSPYNNGLPPLPLNRREFSLELRFAIGN